MAKHISKFEIINHGYDHSQYFQGCGVAFTDFDHVVTGCGMDAKEAYQDAVNQLAMSNYNMDKLPTRPHGIRQKDKIPAEYLKQENNELFWYVSIRVA
jgi:hypothetical protein